MELRAEARVAFESLEWDGYNWYFTFANGTWFRVDDRWRLLRDGRIAAASGDHHQLFGRAAAVDLVAELEESLSSTELVSVEVDDFTGDLRLELSSDYLLEIPITSRGYESYEFTLHGQTYIGAGGGELRVTVTTPDSAFTESRRVIGGFGTHTPKWADGGDALP